MSAIRQSERPTIDPELARALRDHLAKKDAERKPPEPPAPPAPPVVEVDVAAPQVHLSQAAPDIGPIALAVERSAEAHNAAVTALAGQFAAVVIEFREALRLVREQVDRHTRQTDALIEAVLAMTQREIPAPVVNVEIPQPKSRRVVVDHWDGTQTQAVVE